MHDCMKLLISGVLYNILYKRLSHVFLTIRGSQFNGALIQRAGYMYIK